ncbi:hypothetical protein CcaverHIS002_0311560 [Cutaneotrichosporon cavernicola]|uniref:E2 ubiquitin-conjugating enzyme n=1 Tax=Cutaneotrichosporon cavernicola TaxID=279322 RepID=A0AA48L347_9TREE|nr:uncharacterized protein CcaverHIS019_0311430 [Cutaneotrichosporon cavernicola]BEI83288.1 hypothetical protein CcaverHIS002_0311560 [Cutaneotrichosporon cavernicola]BEI91073.1 hypothetical protein CcaverHIS019_0311430 [Cutaneotrichosporon cavernicola]BEI98850.1 hypothetical protein CcaverHIS631_0311490 [Cutaneotrichosporon cavernicola]BEJ06623.1 hypothetical protein CcaverHIS641_0311450 [Cutaneotrichosporon cavernicola]
MALTPQALRLLSRELVTLRNSPPEGVRVAVDEDDISAIEGWVAGPPGTPYDGGYFKVLFDFGPEYPNLPPKCTMATKIFHPNISKKGEICVDTLKKGWRKDYGVGHVLTVIKCLLIVPNPDSALDEEAGKQLNEDYDGYCKYAKLITGIHATPKIPPAPFRGATAERADPLLPRPPIAPKSSSPSSLSSSPTRAGALPSRAPLGDSDRQESSPAPTDLTPALKIAVASTKPAVKTAPKPKTAVKRGVRRL